MGNVLLWESDIEEWQTISVDTYRFVIEQAKERLNEVIDESNTISKRGMTSLLFYLAVLTGIFSYLFAEKFKFNISPLTSIFVCVLAVFSIYVFTLLLALVLPKGIFYRGSPPKEIFLKKKFYNLSPEEGLKYLMYNEIERIQDKIDKINALNKKRISQYRSALKISLIYIAITIFTIVKIVISPAY